MGYKFQFITLAGFHSLNLSMFDLARGYKSTGMSAYSRLQEKEFLYEQEAGYEAAKHQRFVGTGYFDSVQQVISSGTASTVALEGSTEKAQFTSANAPSEDPIAAMSQVHSGTVVVAEVSLADSFLGENRWEESDELMPSGD